MLHDKEVKHKRWFLINYVLLNLKDLRQTLLYAEVLSSAYPKSNQPQRSVNNLLSNQSLLKK